MYVCLFVDRRYKATTGPVPETLHSNEFKDAV